MRQTPVDDYLEEISTELPEELYGNLSDAIYETVCEFDEEVAQLKADNAKLREEFNKMDVWHSKELTATMAENAKLREWCSDFWKWADPPFALKSGTFDEYMALVERAVELGVEMSE